MLGLAAVAVSGLPPFGSVRERTDVIAGGFMSHYAWVGIVMLAALILVFCGVLNKIAGLLLGRDTGGHASETISRGSVAALGLPLGALLLFSVWLPGSLRQLMEQAAGIIRGAPWLLTLLVLVPLLTCLLCWPVRNRAVLERLNLFLQEVRRSV